MSDDEPTLPPNDDPQTVLPSTRGAAKGDIAPSSFPDFENYEILDELGRGGMGVVYKARDRKLDRHVALKMVLSGKFASEEELQRFRIEGESAARLDHPGIVPIYETGDVDGNHFFSMKFVEGGSLLDKLDDYKSDQNAVCELMVKIADAVHHAHQRAVLHRDLKPANILVDEKGEPAITDFGLAKRTDGDSELTQTGLVMGTPGFMSPEQASGRKDVTAAADVFSLGALLYWTITGEAPFKGATGMETVIKTIECDVPSIRAVVPKADSDLNLICQKAMHKDPEQRYSSAAAFESDLRAWLEGEPLSVRRASAMNMASSWIQKNLRSVLGACFAGVLCGLLMGSIIGLGNLRDAAATEHAIQKLGDASQTWVSKFVWLKDISKYWGFIQFMMVPAIAVCGFLCVLFVKPKSREANIASGLTSGFIASFVALLLAGGWGLLGELSVNTGYRDIELLSTAMWLESDAERKLVQDALIDRYPGLESMSIPVRQRLVRQKILHQQQAGLTPDLWFGVFASMLFVGIPMALTCILSGSLWRHGFRGWDWFGCTWERAAYLLILFLVLSFWFSPIRPATWLILASIAALLFALTVALRLPKWYWRVAMIPIPFICMFMIANDIESMIAATRAAGTASNDAEFRKSLQFGDRRLEQVSDPFGRYRIGIGWLSLDDEERYQKHCRKLNSGFDYAWKPSVASQLAKICLLRPDLQPAEDLERAFELSEFASSFDSSTDIKWFQSTRALAELRRGDFESALQWNRKCRKGEEKTGNAYRHAITYAVDALAWIKLNDEEKALESLNNGRKVHQWAVEDSEEKGNSFNWHDRRFFRILEKEIESKLNAGAAGSETDEKNDGKEKMSRTGTDRVKGSITHLSWS